MLQIFLFDDGKPRILDVFVRLRIRLDDLFFRFQDGFLGRAILFADGIDKCIMNESCTFLSKHTSHQKVLLFFDKLYPFFG